MIAVGPAESELRATAGIRSTCRRSAAMAGGAASGGGDQAGLTDGAELPCGRLGAEAWRRPLVQTAVHPASVWPPTLDAASSSSDCPNSGSAEKDSVAYWPVGGASWTSQSMMAWGSAPCGAIGRACLATSAFSGSEGWLGALLAPLDSGSTRGAAGRGGGRLGALLAPLDSGSTRGAAGRGGGRLGALLAPLDSGSTRGAAGRGGGRLGALLAPLDSGSTRGARPGREARGASHTTRLRLHARRRRPGRREVRSPWPRRFLDRAWRVDGSRGRDGALWLSSMIRRYGVAS